MKVYTTDRIRNVVLLGHGGSGKTSLVEAMAYLGGITSRLGNVTDGNTISDFDKEEIKRKFSISTSLVPIAWGDVKVNILDAPGYFDFVGEAEEAAAAADAAVIVVNGKNGVEVGTLKAWALCEKYSLPRMIFITNMDFENGWKKARKKNVRFLNIWMNILKNIEKLCWKQLQRQAKSLWIAILQEKSSPCMRS